MDVQPSTSTLTFLQFVQRKIFILISVQLRGRLERHFGWQLLFLLFVVQHLMKGLAHRSMTAWHSATRNCTGRILSMVCDPSPSSLDTNHTCRYDYESHPVCLQSLCHWCTPCSGSVSLTEKQWCQGDVRSNPLKIYRHQVLNGLIKLPWAVKPMIGLTSDVLPVMGFRKAESMNQIFIVCSWNSYPGCIGLDNVEADLKPNILSFLWVPECRDHIWRSLLSVAFAPLHLSSPALRPLSSPLGNARWRRKRCTVPFFERVTV